MKNEQIYKILNEFGLAKEEVAIYLATLELGAQPASVIAKKAGLKRGQTYNKLAILIEKGIIQEFIKNKVGFYTCRPPKTLLSIIEHREEELKRQKQKLINAIPLLDKIQNPLLAQPKVRFFQGVEGIKEIYEDTLRKKDQPIYAVGDFDYMFSENKEKALYDWIWNYSDRRLKNGIWYYGIVNKSENSDIAFKKRRTQKRKLKMLKDVYLPVELNIYGDKVAIMSTYRDMVGIIIEDKPIADMLKNFHKAIWEYLPDYQ